MTPEREIKVLRNTVFDWIVTSVSSCLNLVSLYLVSNYKKKIERGTREKHASLVKCVWCSTTWWDQLVQNTYVEEREQQCASISSDMKPYSELFSGAIHAKKVGMASLSRRFRRDRS